MNSAATHLSTRAALRRLLVAGVLLLAVTAAGAKSAVPQRLTPVDGTPAAPELALKDMDGKQVRLADLRGRVVVINFWATWCPPCRKELPSFARLQKRFKPEQLQVLAVNIGEDEATVFGFIPKPGFTVLLDEKSETLAPWSVRNLPATYVIDREGRMVYQAVGERHFDNRAILAQLRKLLQP